MLPRRSLAFFALRPGIHPSLAMRPCLSLAIRHRISQGTVRQPPRRVWESTTASVPPAEVVKTPETSETPEEEKSGDKSGHINVYSNESILFFDSQCSLMSESIVLC